MARTKVAHTTGASIVEVKGLRELMRVLSKMPKELQNQVRDASQEIATDLVSGARNAASTRQEVLAASGLTVKRDRVPVVKAGTQMLRPGVRASDIFFGAEFGGGKRPQTMQFLPHRGQEGYFLYPTARARGRKYAELWAEAVDKATKDWDYTPR